MQYLSLEVRQSIGTLATQNLTNTLGAILSDLERAFQAKDKNGAKQIYQKACVFLNYEHVQELSKRYNLTVAQCDMCETEFIRALILMVSKYTHMKPVSHGKHYVSELDVTREAFSYPFLDSNWVYYPMSESGYARVTSNLKQGLSMSTPAPRQVEAPKPVSRPVQIPAPRPRQVEAPKPVFNPFDRNNYEVGLKNVTRNLETAKQNVDNLKQNVNKFAGFLQKLAPKSQSSDKSLSLRK